MSTTNTQLRSGQALPQPTADGTLPNYVLQCPGSAEYGHGLTAAQVHLGGCCQAFEALTADEQARTGLRIPTYAHLSPSDIRRAMGTSE